MFAKKTKGLFVEINEFSALAAVTSGFEAPLRIERLEELHLTGEPGKVRSFIQDLGAARGRQLTPTRVGVYPPSRFVRRATVELSSQKARDPNFLPDYLKNQQRIDPEINQVAVLAAGSGTDPDFGRSGTKEVLFCGAESEQLQSEQDTLLRRGIYPDRLEIGTVATLGGLIQYSQRVPLKSPTLLLEITNESALITIVNAEGVELARPIPHGLSSMIPVVQSELGLKDEESARKLFFSDTFDFTEIGPSLLRKMLKELQASIGFYEVQTGQTIGQFFLSLLPPNLGWIGNLLSEQLGVEQLRIDFAPWLQSMKITPGEDVNLEGLDGRWLGLFSLMAPLKTDEPYA